MVARVAQPLQCPRSPAHLRERRFPLSLSPEASRVPRRIFSPIAHGYDRPALLLALGQYRRWHRFLSSRVAPALLPSSSFLLPNSPHLPSSIPVLSAVEGFHHPLVLDMATGTGALALDLISRPGVRVIGADVTRPMLLEAASRADARRLSLPLVECTAEAPPFRDASFDALTFAYLLRYVEDVPATLSALAHLLKPGGIMASLDFGVPRGAWYPLWRIYTDAALPALGRLFSPDWRYVGSFLGPSIRRFYRRWPLPRLLDAWRDAGFPDVCHRRLSFGGGLVIWGTKAA